MTFRSTARGFVTNQDDAPAFWYIGNLWKVMDNGVQTGTFFTLLDQVVTDGGGGGPCNHTHEQDENCMSSAASVRSTRAARTD